MKSHRRTLGILFIIIDDFPNEILWRIWLEHGIATCLNPSYYSIDENGSNIAGSVAGNENEADVVRVWFHAKYPDRVKSEWVRQRLVSSFHFKPEWGSVELTKVMVHMLNEVCKYNF